MEITTKLNVTLKIFYTDLEIEKAIFAG